MLWHDSFVCVTQSIAMMCVTRLVLVLWRNPSMHVMWLVYVRNMNRSCDTTHLYRAKVVRCSRHGPHDRRCAFGGRFPLVWLRFIFETQKGKPCVQHDSSAACINSVLLCVAVCRSVSQCVAVCYSVLYRIWRQIPTYLASSHIWNTEHNSCVCVRHDSLGTFISSVLQCVVVCCSVLHCATMSCSVLQCSSAHLTADSPSSGFITYLKNGTQHPCVMARSRDMTQSCVEHDAFMFVTWFASSYIWNTESNT